MRELESGLRAAARELGFERLGIIPAVPGRRLDAYLAWAAQGFQGEMGYMARPDRVARRQDLQVILPGVQAIVCVGLDYFTTLTVRLECTFHNFFDMRTGRTVQVS